MRRLTHQQMRDLVAREAGGNVKALSQRLKFSSTFVSQVIQGVVPVSKKLAAAFGYKKIEQQPIFEKE